MKTLRHRSLCDRSLLAVLVMTLAMLAALAAGGEAAANTVESECGLPGQSPSMAASFMATPVEPWIFSLPVM